MNVAIHTPQRSKNYAGIHDKLFASVAQAARGNDRLLPVVWRGRIIAWAGWSWLRMETLFIEHKPWMRTWIDKNGLLCGFANVDAIYAAWTASQRCQMFFSKSIGTSSTLGWVHLYMVRGIPGAGTFSGTAFTARQHDDTDPASMWHGGNVSIMSKHLLSGYVRGLSAAAGEVYTFCLYDMVLSYDQCTQPSSSQSFTNTLTAQRYAGSGDPGLSIMGAHNSAPAGIINYSALTYTDQGGTTAQSVPSISSYSQFSGAPAPSTTVEALSCFALTNTNVRTVLSLPLVNGDTGVRKLEAITMASASADTHNYILGFQLAWCPIHVSGEDTYPFDFVTQVPSLVQIKDGACLALALYMGGNAAMNWHGGFNVGWA